MLKNAIHYLLILIKYLILDIARYFHDLHQRACWAVRGVFIAHGAMLRTHRSDALVLAPGVSVGPGSLLLVAEDKRSHAPVASRMEVGRNSVVNEYCNIRAAGGAIKIGENCLLAQMITIVASNHSIEHGINIIEQPWSVARNSVYIGDDVWVGANAVILPGSVIESGAIIAAGAVVRAHVPSNEIWGGVPARRLGSRMAYAH
jgi:carbonic anhydrase/acetyltransferase-like protein (isoleucine patch superfamily)